jgi:hypothetical protein
MQHDNSAYKARLTLDFQLKTREERDLMDNRRQFLLLLLNNVRVMCEKKGEKSFIIYTIIITTLFRANFLPLHYKAA